MVKRPKLQITMQTISIIALIIIAASLVEMYIYRSKVVRHNRKAKNDRFNSLSLSLNRCETLEELKDWRQTMIFNLEVQDFGEPEFMELDKVYRKQLYTIKNEHSKLFYLRTKEGESILNKVKL